MKQLEWGNGGTANILKYAAVNRLYGRYCYYIYENNNEYTLSFLLFSDAKDIPDVQDKIHKTLQLALDCANEHFNRYLSDEEYN